jgi:hypothetical protein
LNTRIKKNAIASPEKWYFLCCVTFLPDERYISCHSISKTQGRIHVLLGVACIIAESVVRTVAASAGEGEK